LNFFFVVFVFVFGEEKFAKISILRKKAEIKLSFMFPVVSSSVPFLCTLLFSKGLQESSKEGRKEGRESEREEEEEEEGKFKRRIV